MVTRNSFKIKTVLVSILFVFLAILMFIFHAQFVSQTNELLAQTTVTQELQSNLIQTNLALTLLFTIFFVLTISVCFFGYMQVKKQYIFPLYRSSDALKAFIAGEYTIRIQDNFLDEEATRMKSSLNTLFKAIFSDAAKVSDTLLQRKYRQILQHYKEAGVAVPINEVQKKFNLTPTQCKAQLEYLISRGYVQKVDASSHVFVATYGLKT